MKYLGKITDNKDLVTKEYADGRVVANPTVSGTVANLSYIGINGTNYQIPSELPAISSSDNGKVLMGVNGVWAAASLPVYDGSVT